MTLTYEQYFDKVYGCWLGKCIAGTIGAPYEGMKQYLKLDYSPDLFKEMLPNDDLDLQVLWLDALERKGVNVTMEDLAQLFSEKNIYWPGEYAWFKKNLDRGIRPPYTGIYENDFYFEGMGCPIRGEIWGMIYPGNPDGAADICEIDGNLDHYGNSVYFEKFWAAMVAASFYETDLQKLIQIGLRYVPSSSKAYRLIIDVLCWCDMEENPKRILSRILERYGHRDCTNSFQNMGIILFSLIKGKGNLIDTTMMAVRCGFDTDCTAGNTGALLGAVLGAKCLQDTYGFKEAGYKLTLKYARKTDRVYDLAADTCRVGLHFAAMGRNPVEITGAEHVEPLQPDLSVPPVSITYDYMDGPYVQPGENKHLTIRIKNSTDRTQILYMSVENGPNFEDVEFPGMVAAPAGQEIAFSMTLVMKSELDKVCESNHVRLVAKTENTETSCTIGLVAKTPYLVYGPFWENNVTVPDLKPGESYGSFIPGGSREQDYLDNIRTYHLNTRIFLDKEYMTLEELEKGACDGSYEKEGRPAFCEGDILQFNDLCSFDGQCALYLKRTILCQENREVNLNLGYTDPFALWLNGELLCRRDQQESWTPENLHLNHLQLKKGENILILRMVKYSGNPKLTLTFANLGNMAPHIVDLVSKVEQ